MTVLINAAFWTPEKDNTQFIDFKNRITKGKLV